MWSNTPLIAADDKNVAILHRWDFPQGDFVITGCVSWLAEAEAISIPSGVEMLAVAAAAAAADDSAEQWHRADEADESCARRPEEGGGGGQRGRQICSTSKLEAARGLFKGRWQQKRAYWQSHLIVILWWRGWGWGPWVCVVAVCPHSQGICTSVSARVFPQNIRLIGDQTKQMEVTWVVTCQDVLHPSVSGLANVAKN